MLAHAAFGDAADLVQDVFAVALERIAEPVDPQAFPSWLLAIARHRAINVANQACKAGDAKAATKYWRKLPRELKPTLEGECGRRGISHDKLDASD